MRMFLGMPDPQFICTDPAPDPSINMQKNKEKNLISFVW
jgi:hypothetical protein